MKNNNFSDKVSPASQSNASLNTFHLLFSIIFLVLGTAFVYYPSLKVPFLLDDYGKIIRNADIKSLKNIPSRLIYPYKSAREFHRNDPSRPLTYLTLTINYHFNRLRPYGYHVVNIAIHCVVISLIFILGLLIFPLARLEGITPPFLAAAIFAVHPINVNVVTYVIGRATSLGTLFYVLAVILFIKAQHRFKWGLIASAICFVFALASNQLAVTLPALIIAADYCLFSQGDFWKVLKNWKKHAIYWSELAMYVATRSIYFGQIGDVEAAQTIASSKDYLVTQCFILWKYIWMALLPLGVSFEHINNVLMSLADPKVLLAGVLYTLLCVLLIKGLKRSWQSTSFILFGILWYFITISPTSSVFPTTVTQAENRVYLPLVGLCLILVYIGKCLSCGIVRERYRNKIFYSIFGLYCLFLGNMTVRRNILYQDPVALWSDVLKRYPNHERAHKNLAVEYMKLGQFDLAADECEKTLAINPADFDTRSNLAAIYYNLGRYRESADAYESIVKDRPDFAPAYNNMGMAYEQLKNVSAATKAYKKAVNLNPSLIEPHNNLANIYLESGRFREAKSMFEAALSIDPHNEVILRNYKKISEN